MPQARFEPTIPESKPPQTHALYRAGTGTASGSFRAERNRLRLPRSEPRPAHSLGTIPTELSRLHREMELNCVWTVTGYHRHCSDYVLPYAALWWLCVALCCIVVIMCCLMLHCGDYVLPYAALWWLCVALCSIVVIMCCLMLHCGDYVLPYAALWWLCVALCSKEQSC